MPSQNVCSPKQLNLGQKMIPESLDDMTECGLLRSKEGCRFGRNWNGYKDEIEAAL